MTKIFIKTFGCSTNIADSETMAGILVSANYKIVDTADEAEVLIINTCTVKDQTERNFFNYLQELPKKPTIIAGCIPQTDPELLEGYSMIGTTQIENLVQVVEETLHGNAVTLIAPNENQRTELPKIRKNPAVEIIPICQGCLGNCSYCKTKSARGDLKSFSIASIKKQAECAVKNRVKEIWITAQDTGAYGIDINTNLPNLLKELCTVEGNFMLRLGMANPNHVLKFVDELIEVFKNKHIFKFLHLPLQSGNDEILKAMNRFYNVEEFKSIIKKFREAIPDITIATDVICGFPGETDEQFKNTIELIKEIRPNVINISRYSQRPKTNAAGMENQIHGNISKERSRWITNVLEFVAFEHNKKWLGWKGKVIIDEIGKDNSWVGRNYVYKPVIIHGKFKLGDIVEVQVTDIAIHDLRAEALRIE